MHEIRTCFYIVFSRKKTKLIAYVPKNKSITQNHQ
uniref:Uncharacterized protein n=1 Tax=viral metagenome TaxID=1070528 RepID=A0A6C0KI51_9ZZZZ